MNEQFCRTEMQVGKDALKKLQSAKVAVFGVGGVGGYVVEALARCGIGSFDIFDNDVICASNLNRQIIALHSTLGQHKVDVCKRRIEDINPNAKVTAHKMFYLPENADSINLADYDYIIDAVDTITAKLELVCRANAAGVPIISSMGAANKLNPAAFLVSDIYKTSVCPVARVMRRELKKRGIDKLKVVFSKEQPLSPIAPAVAESAPQTKRQTPSSNAFVPAAAGLVIAAEVFKDIANKK
ncbi:MAG: tRNA threonylcarbamoyladenosine dehydratase [Oscillospiraceae bacterium]|nr:tRNA threonylcarbamoyladenosine dehydratase [Oscillospiraceae bacterium]